MMTSLARCCSCALLMTTFACGGGDGGDGGTGGGGGTTCVDRVELTNDDISGGTVLEAGSCWLVNEALTLSDGTVDVREGVSIEFATGTSFRINTGGRLEMTGTAAEPVHLTTSDPLVTWKGIQMNDSQGTDNAWQYVVIENAGSEQWTGATYSAAAVFLDGTTTLSMDQVTIRNSAGHGLLAFDETDFSFTNGTFDGNDTPAYLHPQVVSSLGGETVFTGNTQSHVRVVFTNTNAVTGTHTWPELAVPYRVEDRFFINGDLTISDGTVVEVAQDVAIIVETGASLTAVGSAAKGILLRGSSAGSRGFWKGIEVESGGTGAPLQYGATLDFVEIADAGSSQWDGDTESTAALFLRDASAALITNSTFTNSGGYGLFASVNARLDGFNGNSFGGNARAMYLHPDRVGELAGTSTVSGNDEDRIHVVFGNTDRVSVAATWKDLGVPYEITDRFYVNADLILEAGVVLEFAQDKELIVEGGSLTANGTSNDPVVLTGVNAVTPYWKGIEIETNSASNALSHTLIENTGSTLWTGDAESDAAIYLDDGAQVTLDNVEIGPGNGYGVFLADATSTLSCTSVTFTSLQDGDVWDDDANGGLGAVLVGCP